MVRQFINLCRTIKRLGGDQSGMALIYVTMSLPVIIGFGLLAIDVGRVTSLQSSLQHGADSLALAGAAELVQKTAPVILLNGADVSIDDLKAIRTFLDANKPTNMKWDPNAPPLNP